MRADRPTSTTMSELPVVSPWSGSSWTLKSLSRGSPMVADSGSDILSYSSIVSFSAGVTGREVLLEELGHVRANVGWRLSALSPLLTCSFFGDANRFTRVSEGGLTVSP